MDAIAYVSRNGEVQISHLPEETLSGIIGRHGPVGKGYPIYFFVRLELHPVSV